MNIINISQETITSSQNLKSPLRTAGHSEIGHHLYLGGGYGDVFIVELLLLVENTWKEHCSAL